MQPSTSQKILKVISIISVVGAIISIIGAVLMLAGGILFAQSGAEGVVERAAEFGQPRDVARIEAAARHRRDVQIEASAAADRVQIGAHQPLDRVRRLVGIISLVMTVFRGGVDASQYGSLIGSVASSALMFWLANNIRKQNA